MADGGLKSVVDNYREYPIIVVNMSDKPGGTVNTLAKSLFKKLKGNAADDPSLSVSIEDLRSGQEELPSWAITAESTGKIKRYLLNEFCLPSTEGPGFVDYLVWALRAPVRAASYLGYILRQIVGTGSKRQKARALVVMLPKMVMLTIQILAFFYLIPIISIAVIYPLRKWSLRVTILYSVVFAVLVFFATWKLFLPPLVAWVSQLTQQLLALVRHTELSFDLLFPVMATVVFGIGVSAIIGLVGVVRHVMRRADARTTVAYGAVDFAYLLDPLYSAAARGAFEKILLKAGNKKETHRLFVICERGGVLLGYEVLSHACLGKINAPVYLLTYNLELAGIRVELLAALWLLIEPTDWSRFAKTTPHELSWHHWAILPSEELILRTQFTPQDRVPQVQRKSIKSSWFKSSYSMLVDRLIALADQA